MEGVSTGNDPSNLASLKSCFATAKLRNIDGKILGKDGKPMRKAVRQVGFEEPTRVLEDNNESNFEKEPTVRVSEIAKEKNTIHRHDVGVKDSYSFASVLQHKHTKKTMAVSELRNNERVNGAAVVIPMEAVKENGFFFFHFSTREGMEKVLESGSWLVRLVPLILNIWSPNAKLIKDEVRLAPNWVKLHNVPILAYLEVGLSLIATQLGRPIMMDSYTSNMCLDPWGKCTYARVLIEMMAEVALMDSLVVATPFTNSKGHSLDTIEVPPKKQLAGVRLTNTNPPIEVASTKSVDKGPNPSQNEKGMELKNSFASLEDVEEDLSTRDSVNVRAALNVINESDSEDIDEELVLEEDRRNMVTVKGKGASTPVNEVTHD
ncbi:zinc knuckle CX2CX4HX4C containing protein [Tanacetum coccineum]